MKGEYGDNRPGEPEYERVSAMQNNIRRGQTALTCPTCGSRPTLYLTHITADPGKFDAFDPFAPVSDGIYGYMESECTAKCGKCGGRLEGHGKVSLWKDRYGMWHGAKPGAELEMAINDWNKKIKERSTNENENGERK